VDARATAEVKWAYRLPLHSFGVRYYPREICEDISSNLCKFVHFVVKNKHFKQKNSNVHQLPTSSLNYRLPQTLANYLVLDMIGDQCKRKCTTRCLFRFCVINLVTSGHQKCRTENRRFSISLFKSETDFTATAVRIP